MIGLLPTVIAMVGYIGSIDALGASGTAVPGELPDDLIIALRTTFWGVIISVLSLIPFSIFLMLYLVRRKSIRAIFQQKLQSEQADSCNH
jgi:biopolymer transport protein ExbB/TolQ